MKCRWLGEDVGAIKSPDKVLGVSLVVWKSSTAKGPKGQSLPKALSEWRPPFATRSEGKGGVRSVNRWTKERWTEAVASTLRGKCLDWKKAGRGHASIGEDEVAALRWEVGRWLRSEEPLPLTREKTQAVFIPTGKSDEVANLRPIVPAMPVQTATIKALLAAHDKDLAPTCFCAEDSRGGPADTHLVTMRILMERSAEWNDELRVHSLDLSDSSGSFVYEVLWRALKQRIGAQGALDVLRTVTGQTMRPECCSLGARAQVVIRLRSRLEPRFMMPTCRGLSYRGGSVRRRAHKQCGRRVGHT